MAKFDGILLCTDLDGTLTGVPKGEKGPISMENARAIRYFKENGGLFTLATGRSAPYFMGDNTVFIRSGLEFLPNIPVITHNGASVYDYDKDKYIYSVPLPYREQGLIRRICREWDNVVSIFLSNENGESSTWCSRKEGVDFGDEVVSIYENASPMWYKIVMCVDNEPDAIRLRSYLQDEFEGAEVYTVNRTWSVGVEILAHQATKGIALRWLKNHLGGKIRKAVCMGDFENDESLIIEADLGIAVGNAAPELKKLADLVTIENTRHAVAHVIYSLDELL